MRPGILIEGDSPRARRTDPVTSHEAADATVSARAASHIEVLSVLRALGETTGPVTAEQIEDAHLLRALAGRVRRFSGSRLRSALVELEDTGRVCRVGFGVTRSKVRAQTWEVV